MNIFGILSMIGGLALFLYGMDAMGAGLSKLSGGRMERLLEWVQGFQSYPAAVWNVFLRN